MKCHQVQERLSEYLDGELDAEQARAVQAHLPGCAACARELAGLRAVVQELHSLPPAQVPGGLCSAVMEQLRSQPRAAAPRLWRHLRTGLAAAAAVVVVFAGFLLTRPRTEPPRIASALTETMKSPETPAAVEDKGLAAPRATPPLASPEDKRPQPTGRSAGRRAKTGESAARKGMAAAAPAEQPAVELKMFAKKGAPAKLEQSQPRRDIAERKLGDVGRREAVQGEAEAVAAPKATLRREALFGAMPSDRLGAKAGHAPPAPVPKQAVPRRPAPSRALPAARPRAQAGLAQRTAPAKQKAMLYRVTSHRAITVQTNDVGLARRDVQRFAQKMRVVSLRDAMDRESRIMSLVLTERDYAAFLRALQDAGYRLEGQLAAPRGEGKDDAAAGPGDQEQGRAEALVQVTIRFRPLPAPAAEAEVQAEQ